MKAHECSKRIAVPDDIHAGLLRVTGRTGESIYHLTSRLLRAGLSRYKGGSDAE